ncbi:MAG: protease modulator HflK [Lentisphaeria bacterium]|nr:protease modulator HflK [Lentisphaeria bacterium]
MASFDHPTNEFDKTGQYDSGLQSLVRSLRFAFFALLVLIIGMLVYFFSLGGYTEVRPQEAVIVLRFGKVHEVFPSGWHWFFPYPVSRFVTVRTSPQPLTVNFLPDERMGAADDQLIPGRDRYLITGDANLIHTSWNFQYQITNPGKYYETWLTPADPTAPDELEPDDNGYPGRRGPRTQLENLFRQAVILVTAQTNVDDILYNRKTEYQDAVRRAFEQLVIPTDAGVEIINVSLTSAFAPAKTKAAFDEVAAANNAKETLVNEAEEYRVKTVSEAQAGEAALIAEARTYRQQITAEVKAEKTYFLSILEAYRRSPDTVLMALYNQTLADVLTAIDGKYILGTSSEDKEIRIKLNPEPRQPRAADQAESE